MQPRRLQRLFAWAALMMLPWPALRPLEIALTFGDLNDPESDISKKVASIATQAIRSDLGTDPGVRYMGLDI